MREILRQTPRKDTEKKTAQRLRRVQETEEELAEAYRLAFEAIEEES